MHIVSFKCGVVRVLSLNSVLQLQLVFLGEPPTPVQQPRIRAQVPQSVHCTTLDLGLSGCPSQLV